MSSSPPPGGFLHPTVLSPPASTTSSVAVGALPHPRSHPLKPGGPKESAFIRYVDEGILHIQRRHAKRQNGDTGAGGDARGYESFRDAAKDIESLFDVVWVSGTPSLQVPYLLSLALLVATFLPGFPPAPKATFGLLGKLDLAFASLIQGRDVDTGEPLPGFESGRGVSGTEKVRIKSLVDRTRVCVVEVMSKGDVDEEDGEERGETEDESMAEDAGGDEGGEVPDGGGWEIEIAKVYDRTIMELGDVLGATPITMITHD